MTCEEVRMSLGAHVLGALEPEEAVLVEAHLATCPECRDELAGLTGLTAMLARVGEEDIEQVGRPPHAVLDRLITTSARRRRLNRVVLGLAATLVTVALGGTAFLSFAGGGPASDAGAPAALASAPTPNPSPEAAAGQRRSMEQDTADQPMLATGSAVPPGETPMLQKGDAASEVSGRQNGVSAFLTMTPGTKGTAITVQLSGVPSGTSCRVTAVGRNGTRAPAGSWTVEKADYRDGMATFTGHTELLPATIEGFDISTSTGRRLLWLPLP
ncbi:anti-sigma factor family protein [Sphaerisporangium aureirubrum]|uniref:Anti-sigma factor family protein n=1 Tax=Sphaerisporangium aureirubrum TaxID=1544736 RepID=A0ABW1N9V4_9ACTN